jgi:hypothetical protein
MPESRISFGDCLGAIGYFAILAAALFAFCFLAPDEALAHGRADAVGAADLLALPALVLAFFGGALAMAFALALIAKGMRALVDPFVADDEDEGRA